VVQESPRLQNTNMHLENVMG